ncbi:MAG: LysM peptidoglycan-binding domain-containing protein [Christensenellaceae bacterium]|jgi:hypothetical protein|nr:LysM peptidoglycan-binding domain-containing protein [Christensenellaceae bacterium]
MLVTGDKRVILTPQAIRVEKEIVLRDSQQVITVVACAKKTRYEAAKGEIKVGLKVTYKVIYKSENGIEAQSFSDTSEGVLRNSFIQPASSGTIYTRVTACDFSGTQNIKIFTNIELSGYVTAPYSFTFCEPCSGIYAKTAPAEIEKLVAIKEAEIIASEEYDLKDAQSRDLSVESRAIVTGVNVGGEVVTVNGVVYTHIIYLSGDNLTSRTFSSNFKSEILAQGISENDFVSIIADCDATNLTKLNEDGTKIRIETVISLSGCGIVKEQVYPVVDAYSCDNELTVVEQEAETDSHLCVASGAERIGGSVRIDESKPRIRSVVCVSGVYPEGEEATNFDELLVEGKVGANVIYLDENDAYSQVKAQIPYKISVARNFPCKNDITANTVVSGLTARAKRNDEIEITGEVFSEVYASGAKTIKYIGEIKEKEPVKRNPAALTITFAKAGETLWDIAKKLKVGEDELLSRNKTLELPLKGGEKIVYYR